MSTSRGIRGVCWCDEHVNGAPWRINEHVYVLEKQTTWDDNGPTDLWRWTCTCSSIKAGTWTRDGANQAYHNWRLHVQTARGGWR